MSACTSERSGRRNLPLLKTMCATCPFREDSKYAHLTSMLVQSALTSASRICHSTGSSAINHHTGKRPALCRGARDVQLRYFASTGFIETATDTAWSKKWNEMKSMTRP